MSKSIKIVVNNVENNKVIIAKPTPIKKVKLSRLLNLKELEMLILETEEKDRLKNDKLV